MVWGSATSGWRASSAWPWAGVGWGTFVVGLYSGFLLGGFIGGALAVLRVVDRKGYPFGPFMLVGALIGLLWGADVWSSLVSA